MADPITIITSAASAAAIAFKVSRSVNQLISAIGDAPDDVQALKAEVDGVHSAVVHIHRILQEQNSHWAPTWGQDVESALDRTGDDLIKIHQLVSKWDGNGKIGKTTKISKGIQWVFKDSEVGRLTKRIESSKSALLLLIGTMSLASSGRIDQQVNDVHDRVQSLIAEKIVDNGKSAEGYARLGYRNEPRAESQTASGSSTNNNNTAPFPNAVESSAAGPPNESMKGVSRSNAPQFAVVPHYNRDANFKKDQEIAALNSRISALEWKIDSKNEEISQILQGKQALQEQVHTERRRLEEQVHAWRNKYKALATLYSQLRVEHLSLLQKLKTQTTANAASTSAVSNGRGSHISQTNRFKDGNGL